VGLTTLPCKKIVEKPPSNSAIFNGRRLRRSSRPKLGCGAKEKKKKSRRIRRAGHVACMGEMRSAYSVLVGKIGEEISFEKHRRR
jgi:hypothetical protein